MPYKPQQVSLPSRPQTPRLVIASQHPVLRPRKEGATHPHVQRHAGYLASSFLVIPDLVRHLLAQDPDFSRLHPAVKRWDAATGLRHALLLGIRPQLINSLWCGAAQSRHMLSAAGTKTFLVTYCFELVKHRGT